MKEEGESWAVKIVSGFVIILLLGYFLVEVAKYEQEESGGGSGQPCITDVPSSSSVNASGISTSAVGDSQTNTSAPIPLAAPLAPESGLLPATDLDLTVLAELPIPNSSPTVSELANTTFWHEVMDEWGADVIAIVPQTVIGFLNSSAEWKAWANQEIPDPPAWLSTGFLPYYSGQVSSLDSPSGNQSGTGLAQLENIKGFAASVAGLDLAALDFVTFNGLTALQTYFQTKDASLAICQTFPAQLATLFTESFDNNTSEDLRAQYLGRALAITTFMVALGGAKDSFSAKFEAAIDSAGLGDAWPTVKPYLGEIGQEVSGAASTATLSILQTLAARFPQDSVWVAGLTADRVASMVEVLKDDGLPNDFIQSEIQEVAQAASSSSAEDGAAGDADELSYHDGGWLKVSVRSQSRLSLYSDATGRTESIKMNFLQASIPGFDPAKASLVEISYRVAEVNVYNYYGGPGDTADGVDIQDGIWTPSVPSDVAQPGAIVEVQFSLLTPEIFAEQMPTLEYNGFLQGSAPWMTLVSQTTGYAIAPDGDLVIGVQQLPFAGIDLKTFQTEGTQPTLGFDGKVAYLDFQVIDAFGQPTEMRLVYNGYNDPEFRITSGGTNAEFSPVYLISSDGVKLKFLEGTGGDETSVATIFEQPPTSLYKLTDMSTGNPAYQIDGASAVYQINQVTPTRSLEYTMAIYGEEYDKGFVGAEIAYTVAATKLGVQNLILHEPSEGGADLNTVDNSVVIQARLVDLSQFDGSQTTQQILGQLTQMKGNLDLDFQNNAGAQTGYLIISYIDSQHVIHTIIVEVPRP